MKTQDAGVKEPTPGRVMSEVLVPFVTSPGEDSPVPGAFSQSGCAGAMLDGDFS